ncbi:MAG: molybdopterin-synthase adenylyltransferase MoeB [Planctomycetaceae bacterium]|jgi:adenylyltransferase/sulfurtransferase|nr:molybdopterin-synthase adenylyltransferase MoeB [Planctomycetaceae bacterium]
MQELSIEELTRYSRHLILPEVGLEGQLRLKNGRVLLIGTGGLGSPVALYLAAAGVGTLGIVDFDVVDETNLQRQIIHGTRDLLRPKVASAQDRISEINPYTDVVTFNVRLDSENALGIIRDFDVVVDGTDNYATRYLVNDACVLLGKPNVYGSIFRFEGQASVFNYRGGPCYRCLYSSPPPPGLVPSCAEGGVLGVLPGIIGCIQANEALKILLNDGETLSERLLFFDAWKLKFRELKLRKDKTCPICGENPTIHELVDYEEFCGLKGKGDNFEVESISAVGLRDMLESSPETLEIIDIREPHEVAMGMLPRSRAIPFGQVVRRKDELNPNLLNVFICKIGTRSEQAIKALKESGFEGRLMNLQDGTNAWARDVGNYVVTY